MDLLTIAEFCTLTKIGRDLAYQKCHSKLWRQNKIARKIGRRWRINLKKYMEVEWQ